MTTNCPTSGTLCFARSNAHMIYERSEFKLEAIIVASGVIFGTLHHNVLIQQVTLGAGGLISVLPSQSHSCSCNALNLCSGRT